jgi:formylglycine-generating enzyme required for sulfatase activity
MPSRRFVLAGSLSALAAGRLAAQPAADGFAGAKAGAEREINGIRFCWCPPGRFLMGSPPDEPGRRDNENQVAVTLTRGFWMGKYEVTQGQWARVLGQTPGPLIGGAGSEFPVYFISYGDAQNFCRALNAEAHSTGALPAPWRFDLPTEAQWEYAARAGTTTPYAFGTAITPAQANFGKPYSGRASGIPGEVATPVGAYPPNAWGLHDMQGNEFECAATGITPACRAAPIPISAPCAERRTATAAIRVPDAAAPGWMARNGCARRCGFPMSRNAMQTISACVWRW